MMEQAINNSHPYTVKFPGKNSGDLKNPTVNVSGTLSGTIPNPFIIPGLKKLDIDSQLNPSYTFDNFVEGGWNDAESLACSLSGAVYI